MLPLLINSLLVPSHVLFLAFLLNTKVTAVSIYLLVMFMCHDMLHLLKPFFLLPNVPAPPPRHPEPLLANLVFPFTFLLIMRLLSWQPISLETLLLPTKSRHLLSRPTRPLPP
jgi:hypothetical protein